MSQRLKELERRLKNNPALRRGYVASADNYGRVGWVPWQQSIAPRGRIQSTQDGRVLVHRDDPNMVWDPRSRSFKQWKADSPKKRTPLARVESLTRRLVEQFKANGVIPGELLTEITGEYWKAGAPITTEQLRRVAAELLKREEMKSGR